MGLASLCGDEGTCGECRVRLASGKLTPSSLIEEAFLSKAHLSAVIRLDCQDTPFSDVKLDIPPESLTAAQRLQLDGEELHLEPRHAIHNRGAHGLAVENGSTKMAAYLVDPEWGWTNIKDRLMFFCQSLTTASEKCQPIKHYRESLC